MKYIFLLNSFTLKNKINKIENNIRKYCINNKINFTIEINNKINSTEKILNKYKKSKFIIIPVGGDGIINRVLNNIINTNNILGFVPYGTGNDFFKSVKSQFDDGINYCDVVKINNKYFINTACFGIDADVANNEKIMKSNIIPQKQKYNIGAIFTFIKYNGRIMKLNINNQIFESKFNTVAVCNGMYYGGGYKISPLSILNDGYIDVCVSKYISKLYLLKMLLKMKKGKHIYKKDVLFFKTKKLTIFANDKIKCNIDGEVLENKKFDIEVINKIKIFYDKNMIKCVRSNL